MRRKDRCVSWMNQDTTRTGVNTASGMWKEKARWKRERSRSKEECGEVLGRHYRTGTEWKLHTLTMTFEICDWRRT